MTLEQFERWRDFALRMARTCYATSRRPSVTWIEEVVRDFFSLIDDEDVPCIVDWNNSQAYAPGSRLYQRTYCCPCWHCGGSPRKSDCPYKCEDGEIYDYAAPYCMADAMMDFLEDYRPSAPDCRACSSDVIYSPRLDAATGRYRVVGIRDYDAEFADPGCDCLGGHRSAYEASECQKWIDKRDGRCQCDEIGDHHYEQWNHQWGDPIRCCVRAGLDCAASPSAGVLGFTAGDVRRMYPEGVPTWVFPPAERLQHWPNGEPDGFFVELPDSAGVVL